MRNIRSFVFLGIWVAVLPYLGFPHSWKSVLLTLTGLVILFLTYRNYRDKEKGQPAQDYDNFAENSDFIERETYIIESDSN